MEDTRRSYQTHPYLQERWSRVGRKLAYTSTTRDERSRWRRKTLRTLKQLIGYDTMLPADPEPRVTEEIAFEGYRRQRIEIQTEPGVIMPLYVLIPTRGEAPYPVIIATHGHSSGGKLATIDDRQNPEVSAAIDRYNYGYGARFAEAGFITFCPDARGFGERQEEAERGDILASSCRSINNMAFSLGQTVTGMWTWDIHRLIDYIQARADCDPARIGCAGLSGGGLQTLWAAALDTRIRCSIISGYLYGYRESLLDLYTNCSCNYVPHLYEHVDMGDIAALLAPRPLLVESGSKDPLNGAGGLANVESQMQTIRTAYRLFEREDLVKHDIFEGEHMWHGAGAIPWMTQHLMDEK